MKHFSRYLAWIVCLLIFLANCAAAEDLAQDKSSAVPQHNQWLQEHLLGDNAKPPFSFVYDRQASGALLKDWPKKTETRQLDSARAEHVVTWTDPKSGLRIRIEATEFAHSAVVEWTAYFRNDGKLDSSILEYVEPLDVSFAVTGSGIPTILYSKGCGGMDTYALVKKPLNQLESFQISNEGGGKTVETIPFFDIQTSGGGLIGAVGWPANGRSTSRARPSPRLRSRPAWKQPISRFIPAKKFERPRFSCCRGKATISMRTIFCGATF